MKNGVSDFTYTLEHIGEAAKWFWEQVRDYRVIAFSGEMGAGKTTFIHELCTYLGVNDTVSSPTFALINEYHFMNGQGNDTTIYHMDWYRLKDTAEAIHSGMEDCIIQAKTGKDTYCYIEWPEKAPELLTAPYVRASIRMGSPTERTLSVEINP